MLIALTIILIVMGIAAVIKARKIIRGDDSELGDAWLWQFIPFEKLTFSVDEVIKCLVDGNIIS